MASAAVESVDETAKPTFDSLIGATGLHITYDHENIALPIPQEFCPDDLPKADGDLPSGTFPFHVRRYRDRVYFKPTRDYRFAWWEQDKYHAHKKLMTYLIKSHLPQTRLVLNGYADFLWYEIMKREDQLRKTPDGKARELKRKEVELLSSTYAKVWRLFSEVSWVSSESRKILEQMQAARMGDPWTTPDAWTAPGRIPLKDVKLSTSLFLDDARGHYKKLQARENRLTNQELKGNLSQEKKDLEERSSQMTHVKWNMIATMALIKDLESRPQAKTPEQHRASILEESQTSGEKKSG